MNHKLIGRYYATCVAEVVSVEGSPESLPVQGVGPVSTGSKAPDYSRWKTELEANIRALGCAVPTNETFYERLWAKTRGASPAASNAASQPREPERHD